MLTSSHSVDFLDDTYLLSNIKRVQGGSRLSVNGVDWKVRNGNVKLLTGKRPP